MANTLRHTAITHLVQAGIDLPTVKRISGHKTLAMVERYSHQNGAHIGAATDRLEKRYGLANRAEKAVVSPVLADKEDVSITPELHKALSGDWEKDTQVFEKDGGPKDLNLGTDG